MGEAARREAARRTAEAVTNRFASDGMLIEGGWAALCAVWVPRDAPPEQIKDLRWAFMAGAEHLFSSIMTTLDPGSEITDEDLRKMELIQAELDAFRLEVEASLPTAGRA